MSHNSVVCYYCHKKLIGEHRRYFLSTHLRPNALIQADEDSGYEGAFDWVSEGAFDWFAACKSAGVSEPIDPPGPDDTTWLVWATEQHAEDGLRAGDPDYQTVCEWLILEYEDAYPGRKWPDEWTDALEFNAPPPKEIRSLVALVNQIRSSISTDDTEKLW